MDMISTYQRLKRRRDNGEIDGFTLIELLIVIVVLGILAAVVIFALGGITGKSQLAACQADGATVSTALAAFHAQNPQVTPSQLQLTATTSTKVLGGPYIQSWPNATSYAYSLGAPATGSFRPPLQVAPVTNGTAGTPIPYLGPASCGPAAKSATSIGL